MNFTFRLKPNGWKKWAYPRTALPNATRGVPYAFIPSSYTPAKAFWVQGIAMHCNCLIPPWSNTIDPYSAFLMGGGASGSILGSVAGISAAQSAMNQPLSASWGLGGNPPPTLGYCIGDLYKENVYFRLLITRVSAIGPAILVSSMTPDVFQRSRLKRIYVHHGEVRVYIPKNGDATKGNLLLDIDGEISSDVISASSISGTIKITKKSIVSDDGTISPKTITLTITTIKPNFSFDVSGSDATLFPEAGDFYEFSKPLCIENPLLISGIWNGKESESSEKSGVSGFDAHTTQYSSPYEDLECSGFYVFKNTGGEVKTVSPSSPLTASDSGEWCWKSKEKASDIFLDDPNRYKESYAASNASTTGIVTSVVQFEEASDSDIGESIKLDPNGYVRIELNKAAYSSRHNWQSPILKREWVKQGDKYFKILNQPSGNVIDVSIKDVSGASNFNIDGKMSIFNQYAWMIVEHFMFNDSRGIFEGEITSSKYDSKSNITTIAIGALPNSIGTFTKGSQVYNPSYLNNVNSFFNRYILDPKKDVVGSSMIALYNKNNKWKFVCDRKQYSIKSFSISSPPTTASEGYTVNLTCGGEVDKLAKNGYIAFDDLFEKVLSLSNSGTLFYEITEGVSDRNTPTICLDAYWLASSIKMNVPSNTMIGVCGGRYFGMEIQGISFVDSELGADLFITTPYGASGMGSLYCNMTQEDNVIFSDPYTNKLTIRRGSLGFKDNPKKSEIVMGTGEVTSLSGASTLTLDSSKERVKSISFKTKADEKESKNVMFGIRSSNNIYGIANSGKGDVDLQALRLQGICSNASSTTTVTSASDYQYENQIASPIYIQNRSCQVNYKTYDTVDIGIPTTDSPIIPIGGEISDVTVEYIKENQTIESDGLFDMFLTSCGEKVVVYGMSVPPFELDGTEYNTGSNRWHSSNGVFIVGSGSYGLRWECPTFMNPKPEINTSAYPDIEASDIQYPLLILPDCDYLGGFLNPMTQVLNIFARSYVDGSDYIGCLQVSYNSLPYELKKATLIDANKTMSDFLVRPLSTQPNELMDTATNTSIIDNYTRIIGRGGTESIITSSDAINIISPFIMSDATVGMLYDSDAGIKLLYSRGGNYWKSTNYIISKDSHSPLYMADGLIAYITSSGIEVKLNMDNLLYAAMSHGDSKGISAADSEILQKAIDSNLKVLIGSGQLDSQKLTGYKTADGIYKIFFYDKNNLLSCMESPNMMKWKVAANF